MQLPFNNDIHDIHEIAQKFRRIRNAILLISLGVFLCFCAAGFVAFVSFVLLFVVVPFCFFVGTAIQTATLFLDWVVRPLLQQTLLTSTAAGVGAGASVASSTPKLKKKPQQQQREDSLVLNFKNSDPVVVDSSPSWRTPLFSALALNNTPSPFLQYANSKPLPPVHSDTLEQIRTPLIISVEPVEEASPNVLGLNLVESPVSYIVGENPFSRRNYFEKLSDKIIDQILSHLPHFYIGVLALVSKDLASQFRFRRVHSGTEYYPLSTFNEISKRPRLGENTRRLVVHRTFYRPPVRTQWLLEGSDPNVIYTSWKTTETKKHSLLTSVLQSCRRIHDLTWNEARLSLPFILLKTVELRLDTTLRHLDISAKHSQLVNHVNRHRDPSHPFHLTSIIIRDGFTNESMDAITKFVRISKNTIRRVQFRDSNFGATVGRPAILELLQELPCLERVDFTRPLDLTMAHIPIAHTGLQRGITLNILEPTMSYTHFIPFQFSFPLDHVLSNLTTIIICLSNHTNTLDIDDHDTLFQQQQQQSPNTSSSLGLKVPRFRLTSLDLEPESELELELEQGGVVVRSLAQVVSAAVNLCVFALNAPVPVVLAPNVDDRNEDDLTLTLTNTRSSSVGIKLSTDLLDALVTKKKLVSLSLMARLTTPHQLRRICENLGTLSHLAVYMAGESTHISKYSQYFTKLTKLVALDVAIRSFDQTCPCGHEQDSRFPHHKEGTAMGRLCRRFLPRIDMQGQKISTSGDSDPKHLKLIRLSRLGWHYNDEEHEQIMHEISWFCSSKEVVDQVEKMWGPCEVSLMARRSPRRRPTTTTIMSEEEEEDESVVSSGFELSGCHGVGITATGIDSDAAPYHSSSSLWMELEREAVRKLFSPVSWTEFVSDGST